MPSTLPMAQPVVRSNIWMEMRAGVEAGGGVASRVGEEAVGATVRPGGGAEGVGTGGDVGEGVGGAEVGRA